MERSTSQRAIEATRGDDNMATLTDKTALVTGASRGIGRATAEALSNAGAHVIVHYGRAATEANTVVEEIRAAAVARMPRKRTCRFPREPQRLRSRFAQLSANTWIFLCQTPASLKLPRSRITQ